jgi:hypothetical protein
MKKMLIFALLFVLCNKVSAQTAELILTNSSPCSVTITMYAEAPR